MQPIQALINLYDKLADHLPPVGWIPVRISYIIDINQQGELIAITNTDKTFNVPCYDTGRTNGVTPYTLWDKREYIFGELGDAATPNKYQNAAIDYYKTLPDHVVAPVLKFMEKSPATMLRTYDSNHPLLDAACKQTNCAFRVSPNLEILVNHPDIVKHVATKLEVVDFSHTKISGVPGGNSAGASFVSYNNPSSNRHYECVDNNLDCISYLDMLRYTAVMQYLIRHQKIKLSDNMSMIYATDTTVDSFDIMDTMFGYSTPTDDKNKMDNLVKDVYAGRYAESLGNLIVWTLRGSNGRVALVNFTKITISEVQQHCKRWFEVMGPVKIWQVLELIDHPHAKRDLIRAIIFGDSLPAYFQHAVAMRLRSPNTNNRSRELLTKILMYINGDVEMQKYGIIVGKLLMVYEAMQHAAADGSIGVNITEKYLRQMLIKPDETIVTIAQMANHWRSKLRRVGKNVRYDKMIDSLMADLAVADRGTMNSLDVHIGYHLQRQEIFAKTAIGE